MPAKSSKFAKKAKKKKNKTKDENGENKKSIIRNYFNNEFWYKNLLQRFSLSALWLGQQSMKRRYKCYVIVICFRRLIDIQYLTWWEINLKKKKKKKKKTKKKRNALTSY